MSGNLQRDKRLGACWDSFMTTALEIEKAIERLPEPEQRKLAGWFEDHRLIVESSAVLASFYAAGDGGASQLTADLIEERSCTWLGLSRS